MSCMCMRAVDLRYTASMPNKDLLLVIFSLAFQSVAGYGTQSNYFPFVNFEQNGAPSHVLEGESVLVDNIVPRISFGSSFVDPRTYNSVNINRNGYLYFGVSGPAQRSDGFSSTSTPKFVIAPFWDSVGSSGVVRYEQHDVDTGGILRSDVNHYINDVLGVSIEQVNSLLVVEWRDMQSDTIPGQATNTFQAVIASSSFDESYAIFTYKCGELGWSTSSSTIGFYASLSEYRNHPLSRISNSPNPIACVNSPNSAWSNVLYRIDSGVSPCVEDDGFFGCTSGTCTPLSNRCSNGVQCFDGTDEIGCNLPVDMNCDSTQFSCVNGGCVDYGYRCNEVDDCVDGSDEQGCHCTSFQFACVVGGSCISRSLRCDGRNDCDDGSDEYNCPSTGAVTPSMGGVTSSPGPGGIGGGLTITGIVSIVVVVLVVCGGLLCALIITVAVVLVVHHHRKTQTAHFQRFHSDSPTVAQPPPAQQPPPYTPQVNVQWDGQVAYHSTHVEPQPPPVQLSGEDPAVESQNSTVSSDESSLGAGEESQLIKV